MKEVAERTHNAGPVGDFHHLEKACRLLVAEVTCRRSGRGRVAARVVDQRSRPYSTIHIVRVESSAGDWQRFYVKTLKAGPGDRRRRMMQVITEYRVLSDLWERFALFSDLGVVRPVVCLPQDLALITEEFAGQKLDSVLAGVGPFQSRRELERLARLCRLVGSWLHHFQAFTALPRSERYDLAEIFDYCEERVKILLDSGEGRLDATYGDRILSHLEWLAGRIEPSELELTGRQNDFRPDNMVTQDGRLAVLDFTGFTHGPRLYDLIKFWMRLDYYAFGPLATPSKVEVLKDHFLEGYGRPVNVGSPLAQILRLANLLDKMSELREAPSPRGWKRLLYRRWFRYLTQQVEVCLGSP